MAEFTEEPVDTFAEVAWCKCGGALNSTGGVVHMTNPPGIPHKCDKCGHVEYLGHYYPRTFSRIRNGNDGQG